MSMYRKASRATHVDLLHVHASHASILLFEKARLFQQLALVNRDVAFDLSIADALASRS